MVRIAKRIKRGVKSKYVAYCVKCKSKHGVVAPVLKKSNGAVHVSGKCSKCNTKVSTFAKA